ncbi:RNA polymerase sigma factor [Sediminicola luteus]|uniref:RNA polymerase sigma factor n=1 Tax=Sediminicola luteus TaxID=319238 RepID=A0A2A4G7A7_9FLAO|nr:RNA polymerase sigma factor [Sediminicola luteus]PCE63858.1 hypothetical protein B7P33_11360 [Sediminicola luteus]
MDAKQTELFEKLYADHHAMVLQMCLGYLKGDRIQADDVVQEVFIKIWQNLDKFRGASSYKTWIYRITVNSCLGFINKSKKEKKRNLNELSENLEAQESTILETDEAQTLYTAIGKLAETDRLIIMMVLEGQEYDTIGEVMGINPSNVRVKIHRIKKRLKKLLTPTNHG